MPEPLRLMCVLAHPDDETLGTGGLLVKYAAEGVATYLVTATRGEYGWPGPETGNPGPKALGQMREMELRVAAQVLGLHEISFLDYVDGELDQADPAEAIARIVGHLRRVRPQVVVTFAPDGAYGHPDHIAISQFTTAAVVCAPDPAFAAPGAHPPHRVAKLYYLVDDRSTVEDFPEVFDDITLEVDGGLRRAVPWEDWAVTTRIDAQEYWLAVWQATQCHQSQLPSLPGLSHVPLEQMSRLYGEQTLYRAVGAVRPGRAVETDLFEGLR